MTKPGWTTIKTLFATSCNTCAMDGCEQTLTDPNWKQVKADIAHIAGEKPRAPRYDATMTPTERAAFENLMLLCPNCHRLIDRLQPDDYPVGRLQEIKSRHEERCKQRWASDERLDVYTELLMIALNDLEPPAPVDPPPRLQIQMGDKESVYIVNTSDADAFSVRLELPDQATADAWASLGDPPQRLSPGGRFRAGGYVPTLGNGGPHSVHLRWADFQGNEYDASYPLG